jgi:deoxyadenosine/deoxycytidine kinase
MTATKPLIGVVGPCAAGKSTLVSRLLKQGYYARNIAQEHSYVPDMWKRLTKPDLLIYLDVSYFNSVKRRALNWTSSEYEEQIHRLRHARQHSDLIVDTNPLDEEEVFQVVRAWLDNALLQRSSSDFD